MLASSSLIVMILLLLIIIMLVVLMFQSSLSLAFHSAQHGPRARRQRPPAFRIRVAVAPGDGARSKGTPFAHIFHKEVRFSRVLKNARLIGRKSSIALFNGVISEIRHTVGTQQ
jgi:hypothetical protein